MGNTRRYKFIYYDGDRRRHEEIIEACDELSARFEFAYSHGCEEEIELYRVFEITN